MILSDFLSRQKNDNRNPHEIIPLSFNMCQVLDDNYYNENFLIQTRSQAKKKWYETLRRSWCGKEFRSQPKARKVTCHFQTRKYGKAMYRSGNSWIKKKEN